VRRRAVAQRRIPGLPGARVWRFGAGELVRPPAPDRVSGTDEVPPLVRRTRRLPQPFVAEIPDVSLVGTHAVPFTDGGKMLLTPFLDGRWHLGSERHPELEEWVRGERFRRLDGGGAERLRADPVCSTVSRLDGTYFHWIIDICGQLEALEHYRERTGIRPSLLVRESSPNFVWESLELLGIARADVIGWPLGWQHGQESDDRDRLSALVSRLVVPSWRGQRHVSSPHSLQWLRSRFLEAVKTPDPDRGSDPESFSSRLYIARSSGGWRSIVNGTEVEGQLVSRGFEVIRPEELTLGEQIRRFAAAQLIVGMHGAGLANIIFAPDAHLVELAATYGTAAYFSICSGLGNPYTRVSCADRGDDLIVDLAALDAGLQRLHT
jgi:hypothetical protein